MTMIYHGRHPRRGLRFAAVDPHAPPCQPKLAGGPFGAVMAPFRTSEAAMRALLNFGAEPKRRVA
ncbi:MAG TPA: hypothetical protein VF655_00100 [Allosphingosinicella sp.]|jgi:hypothetical protein